MIKIMFALCMAMVATNVAAQEVYKCKVNGAMVIQDRPCPGSVKRSSDMPQKTDAQSKGAQPQATDQNPKSDIERNKEFLAARDKERRINDIKSEIENQENEIAASQTARDRELAALRNQKSRALNNLAGATWEQSISAEMQAVTARYDSDINAKQQRLKQLYSDLEAARKN